MSDLAWMAAVWGACLAVGHGAALIAPGRVRTFVTAFPRSRFWGWSLSAAALMIASALLWQEPPEWLAPWKQSVWVLCPVAIVATGLFLDELLAARALGGLLLLAAAPLLAAARFHPSPARLVMTVTAYAAVGLGLLWVSNPWWVRKLAAPVLKTDTRLRAGGLAGLLFGALLIGLAVGVY